MSSQDSGTPSYTPLLRWAGSKRAKAGYLAEYWQPGFQKYIEPFCGSAALFFRIAPAKAVLSDLNGELINFYKAVTSDPAAVYRKFSKFPRDRDTYYHLRKQYPRLSSPTSRAAVFYYLNKNCFNGLYRTNRAGGFNVPYSDKRVGRYPSRDEFVASCAQLIKAKFACGDFADVVSSNVAADDFVYLDPPYASEGRIPFREYGPDSFNVTDIERLGTLLNHIDRKGAKFVLSYAQNPTIQVMAKKWRRSTYEVRRHIAGFSDSRRMSTEQVITNIEE